MVNAPMNPPSIPLAHSVVCQAARRVHYRVGVCRTGLIFVRTPEMIAAALLGRLLQVAPQTLPGRSCQNATPPRRLILTWKWDGGPTLSRLTDPESGFRIRWNIADAGQLTHDQIVDAIEHTTEQDTVEQVQCVYAYPDLRCYQQMSQVLIRAAASDTMA
eukprot:7157960-Pyramimonas_sp.AAC.1